MKMPPIQFEWFSKAGCHPILHDPWLMFNFQEMLSRCKVLKVCVWGDLYNWCRCVRNIGSDQSDHWSIWVSIVHTDWQQPAKASNRVLSQPYLEILWIRPSQMLCPKPWPFPKGWCLGYTTSLPTSPGCSEGEGNTHSRGRMKAREPCSSLRALCPLTMVMLIVTVVLCWSWRIS